MNNQLIVSNTGQPKIYESNTSHSPGSEKSLTLNISNNQSLDVSHIFDFFDQLYSIAPYQRKELSSYNFSLLVKQAETLLLKAEEISKCNPEFVNQVIRMKKQFNDLIKMMPEGPCVLLHQNIVSLKKLNEIPIDKFYRSNSGIWYHEPQVTVMQMANYFQKFKESYEYLSITVVMKTDHFYGLKKNGMVTTIGFKNKEILFPRIQQILKEFNFSFKEDIEKLKHQLNEMVSKKVEDWSYDNYEIIFAEETKGEVYQKIKSENLYFCYIIFYHKQAEKTENI